MTGTKTTDMPTMKPAFVAVVDLTPSTIVRQATNISVPSFAAQESSLFLSGVMLL